MKLEQLSMFKAVAELGSLRQASELMHKTQPAISQGIRQLESILAVNLFNRSGYRLALTTEGKVLYQHALRVLDEANALREMARHIHSGNETSVTLATEASFDLKSIIPLLTKVQNQFPDTKIVLKQEHLTGAFEALMQQEATLCISPINDEFFQDSNVELHLLNSGRLVTVASPVMLARHPNLQFKAQLTNEYQIVLQDSGKGSSNKSWGIQQGQRCWYVSDFATKKMLIESGMGWGSMPYHQIQKSITNNELVVLNLADSESVMNFNYYIIKNKQQLLGPVAQSLWQHFKAYTAHPLS
ncbi:MULTISPECIES: LysR family transcriptional regulator [Pseudomonadati]|uniref:LysR family transcriptional regulator n=1 Tax=Shewanella aestuarii TaxID=1028752 RepID=A0ABT0L274_9GAMM|nr:LysR family transcriptional regulator [Shewanella aestuarii]MCL1117517.1 LysR family transcriptional regulator [Shewanella aestuarii]GGN75560.1 LysR family transcriptional regulator [Shewanella aestuarii]